MRKYLLNYSFVCLIMIFICSLSTPVYGQTIDSTALFPEPITGTAIVYASLLVSDVNTNNKTDVVFSLSQPAITAWTDYSAAVRFNDQGKIDVRNGSGFATPVNTVPVAFDKPFDCWVVLNVAEKKYSTWIKSEEMTEPILIFENATFRNTGITAIERWSTLHNPLGEPDKMSAQNVGLVKNVGDIAGSLPNYAMSLPGGENGAVTNVAFPAFNLSALPVTIEMWYKPEATQNLYAALIYNRTSVCGIQYDKWTDQSKIKGIWNNENNPPVPEAKPNPGKWNHVALVVTATGKTIYINGVPTSFPGTYTPASFAGTTYLGWDEVAANRTLKGLFDEVRIWNTERSASDLENNKYKRLTGQESGLIGYWNFDDHAEKATDLSPSGFHGTIHGGSYVSSDLFDNMRFEKATTAQTTRVVNSNSSNNVVLCLEITARNSINPLKLTGINLSALGTTQIGDLQKVKIFATGSDSTFATTNLLVQTEQYPVDNTLSLSVDYPLNAGSNHFWIACDIVRGATEDNLIDLSCTSFSLTGDEINQRIPSPAAPDGHLVIRPSLFINQAKLPAEIVSTRAATTVEGANFASFQQNAIMTYNGYQYVTYWSTTARVCLARKKLPDGTWEVIEFSDHTVAASRVADNHYTISMGICKNDGTIHLAFDHHNDVLHYKKSAPNLANYPEKVEWNEASFGPKIDYLVEGAPISNVTYPRFISKPNGDLLYECRLGWSGDGDDFLWEYSAATGRWTYIGEYLNGTSINENAYINGIHYDQNGRLHVSWVWRQTPDAQTNHDICYGYSDDDGRTWYNAGGVQTGTVNSQPMTLSSPGLKVWTVGTYRGLINQESQVVDSQGGIHILQSVISDGMANSTNFWNFRINYGVLRHIYRDGQGIWHNDSIAPSTRNRSEIAIDANNNLYVVAPNYRIYFAAAADNWKTWTGFDLSEAASAINEGLIDREALLDENVLSFAFAQTGNKIIVPNYLLEKKKTGQGRGLSILKSTNLQFADTLDNRLGQINLTESDCPAQLDQVAIRCEGTLETVYPEAYTLNLTVSGATKLWLGDSLVVETQASATPAVYPINLKLLPSHKYPIRLEGLYSKTGLTVRLEWSSESQVKELVPLSSLYKILHLPLIGLSSDAALMSLSASIGTITPIFHPDTTVYTLLVTNPNDPLVISAMTRHARATATGTGPFTITGSHDQAKILVTAEDGITTSTYILHIVSDTRNNQVPNQNIDLYPVVSSEGFTLSLPSGGGSLEVTAVNGQKIMATKTQLSSFWFDIPQPGVYIVTVKQKNQTKTFKVIKTQK